MTKLPSENSKATKCAYCGHYYIEPCSEAKSKTCANLAAKKEATAKKGK